jgi:hypothetical protein
LLGLTIRLPLRKIVGLFRTTSSPADASSFMPASGLPPACLRVASGLPITPSLKVSYFDSVSK